MNKERFKVLLRSLKLKPKTMTTKIEDGKLYLYLSLKRYTVTEKDDKIMLTTREGRAQPANRVFYGNRKLT